MSVHLPQASTVSKRLNGLSSFLQYRLPLVYPTLCCKGIWVSPKIRSLPSGTLSQTLDLKISSHHVARRLSQVLPTWLDRRPSLHCCVEHYGDDAVVTQIHLQQLRLVHTLESHYISGMGEASISNLLTRLILTSASECINLFNSHTRYLRKYSMYWLQSVYMWIGERTWLVISTLLLKLKGFLRLQAVTCIAEVVISRKRCKKEILLLQIVIGSDILPIE